MKYLNKFVILTAIGSIFCANNAFADKNGIKLIDFEHHFIVPEAFEGISNNKTAPKFNKDTLVFEERDGAPMPYGITTITGKTIYKDLTDFAENRIANMDKAGVDMAVLSSSNLIEDLPKEEAIKYAKISNDTVYNAVKKYPDRFIASATLPTPYVQEAIKELRRCHNMGFKYWHTHSNYKTSHLYDKKYEPLLAEAEKLGMPIYLHPQYPVDKEFLKMGSVYAGAGLGFGQDVMQTSLRMILNGTFDRHPNLRMIIGHLGEYYPFVLERMENRFNVFPEAAVKNKHPISYYFKNKNILVTTSGNMSKAAFKCTKDVLGIDNIMFASDYPLETYNDMVDFVENLDLTKEEREKLYHKNGEKYILK